MNFGVLLCLPFIWMCARSLYKSLSTPVHL
jgi:hypothetical protein